MQTRWVGYVVALSALAFTNGASAAPKVTATEAAPAKPKATKLKVTIDAAEIGVTISPIMPAFIGDDRWSHVLAIVPTDRTADTITLNVGAFPKTEDRSKLTNERVVQQATLKQSVTGAKALVIVPGKELAKGFFGAKPPAKIVITWVAN